MYVTTISTAEWLLLGLQFILTIAALVCYVRIWRHEDACEEAAKTAQAFARAVGNAAPLDRLQRLEGHVYSQKRVEKVVQHAPCPNYALAQLEGPGSKAATCECEYCEFMREQRDMFRAEAGLRTPMEIANGKRTDPPRVATDGGAHGGGRSSPARGRKKATPQRPQANGRAEDAQSSAQTGDGPQLPPQT